MHRTFLDRTPISRRGLLVGFAAAGAGAILSACGATGGTTTGGAPTSTEIARTGRKVVVVATTTFLQDFARAVGGDRVAVSGILAPGANPHDYEPTAADATALARADLIASHGAGLDAWLDKLTTNANSRAPRFVATNGLVLLKGDGEFTGGDPHVWHDPTLVKSITLALADALGRVDAAHAASYRQNAATYGAQLDALDTNLRARYDSIPATRRKLVTNHDAFQYLARHYNLHIVGAVIPSLSDAAEPSPKDITDLIATIKREGVPAIFAESQANPRVAEQVAREAGVKIVDTLYADSLGPTGSDADTYLKMMDANATAIVNALR